MSLTIADGRCASSRLLARVVARLLGRPLARQRHLGVADQRGQRRAQLVRHVGVGFQLRHRLLSLSISAH